MLLTKSYCSSCCLYCFVLDVAGGGQARSGSRPVHASTSGLTERGRGSQCAFNQVVLYFLCIEVIVVVYIVLF